MTGIIQSFDDARGDGVFRAGNREYYFHCVTIADGTRTIAVGVAATAQRCVGHLGVDEACEVMALA